MAKRPMSGGRRRASARALVAAWGAAIVCAALWTGCTVSKRNYPVLSFFFDGVPDPSLPKGAVNRGDDGKPVFVVVHRPYFEEKCDACHRTKYRPTRNDSSACQDCHAVVKTAYPKMHGAVEANACLWCHSPHESSRPHLLRDADRKLCLQCHEYSLLSAAKVPAHRDESRGCLECHSGHGGTDAHLLKPANAGSSGGSTEKK